MTEKTVSEKRTPQEELAAMVMEMDENKLKIVARFMLAEQHATVQEKLQEVTNDVAVMMAAAEIFEHSTSEDVCNGLRQRLGDAYLKLREIIAELDKKAA